MNAHLLRRAAAFACLGMAFLLLLLQFVLTPDASAPMFLFVLFTGLWVFGFAMLLLVPTFGAVGTTLWGLLSAGASYATHQDALSPENVAIIVGSLVAAGLAAAALVARVRGDARAA